MMREPPGSEYDPRRLAETLGELIRSNGATPFLGAPLVEPTRQFFPFAWTPDHAGARRVLQRLLRHSGIGSTALRLIDGGGDGGVSLDEVTAQEVVFGVSREALEAMPPTISAAVMAREVSRAWRLLHALSAADPGTEEELVDLSAIYLGFGVLVVNGACVYRTLRTLQPGSSNQSTLSVTALGVEAISHAFALQVVARGIAEPERRRLARILESNQEEAFLRSCHALDQDPDALAPLGLTDADRHAARASLSPGDPDEGSDEEDDEKGEPGAGAAAAADDEGPQEALVVRPNSLPAPRNAGKRVYLVRPSATRNYLGPAVGLALFVDLALISFFPTTIVPLVILIVAAVAGMMIRRPNRWGKCAAVDCGTRILVGSTHCPECGGRIVGVAASYREIPGDEGEDAEDPVEHTGPFR